MEETPGASKAWIWGDSPPPPALVFEDEHKPLAWQYPEHGFIELTWLFDRVEIHLVKRPPARFFPENEKFCSTMLPAAIRDILETNEVPVELIQIIGVTIDAYPYRAACKCYMRVLMGMGLNRVGGGDGVVVTENKLEEFCDYEHVRIEGRPAHIVARLPEVNSTAAERLRAASFITESVF